MEALELTCGSVFSDRGRLYTASACPGKRIYGERLVSVNGTEYREWEPRRSKLSAYLSVGGNVFPFERNSKVLYLGASSGTTPSHVADICPDGRVYCIEFAQRMFRELVGTCSTRPNMMPILGDATKPDEYAMFVNDVDIVYQDVAQKNQASIICRNMDRFDAEWGMLAIKARSEDATASDESVFMRSEEFIRDHGFRIVDTRSIEPYEKSHEMIVFRK